MHLRFFRRGGIVFVFLLYTVTVAQAQVSDSTAVADSLLIQDLARELGPAETTANPTPVGSVTRNAPTLNPNISMIGDFRAMYQSDVARNVDAQLHEAEMGLQSVVDPYARADFFISAAPDENGDIQFELEEAYLTSLSLPHQLQLKAGKFRSSFGKINMIHPHALPFIDIPAVYVNYFGEDGLNDQGVSLSWLLPNSHFFQDLTVQVTRGPVGGVGVYTHDNGNQLLYVAHLKNFWDLSENATIELGFSGAAGPNELGRTNWLGGIDFTYKWKPLQFNTYRSFTLQVETFFNRKNVGPDARINTFGMYALASYSLGRRWLVVGRFDHSDLPDNPSWNENGFSTTLGFRTTEFQKIELGVRTSSAQGFDQRYQAILRAVFVIGAHGAHAY